ncbi:MAG: MFS transporter [Actinomycetota bacterium]|nr:MFS transporter [Actinomycetota bacterium]
MSEQLQRAPAPAGPGPDDGAVQRRTVRVLSASQVLGGVGVGIGIAIGGLLAERISGTEAVAGLAQTVAVIGSALIAVPVSRIMSRSGRRPGLVTAYAVAVLGCVIVVVAAAVGSFLLMLPGMFLFGGGTTAGLQARFAATDLATAGQRGRALSMVVWATTVGAVLGPNLAGPSGDLATGIGLPPLAGPFLVAAVLLGAAAVFVAVMLRPDPLLTARSADPPDPEKPVARLTIRQSIAAIVSTANGRLGLLAVVSSHAVMVAVMVLTPVHLGHGGAELEVIGLVISVHIAGMYAFSPLVGWLADRLGRRRVILVGACVQTAALLIAGTAPPQAAGQLGVGLFLLGLGWSCGLIAGSTLVTDSVSAADRPFAQGATDLVMGLFAGLAGAVAGPIVGWAGYGMLNVAAGVILTPLFVLALWTVVLSPGRGTA